MAKNGHSWGIACVAGLTFLALLFAIARMWGAFTFTIYLLVAAIAITAAVWRSKRRGKNMGSEENINFNSLSATSPSKGSQNIEWRGKGTAISVGDYVIQDPLTYFSDDGRVSGNRVSQFDQSGREASCLYRHLAIGRPVLQEKGALGYWPSYASISPDQRANYLQWMALGKKDDLNDIGYAFLYFYGLERRLLVDNQDFDLIIPEVARLLSRYTFSGSFLSYLSSFICYNLARMGLEKVDQNLFDTIFLKSPVADSETGLAVATAWLYIKQIPLSLYWATRIARQDPRTPRSVVTQRVPEEFQKLFEIKYNNKFSDGLMLKVSSNQRRLDHHPASPSLGRTFVRGGYQSLAEPILIPNVLGIQSQFNPILQIYSECIDELKSYSHKALQGVDGRDAFEALPDELKKGTEHPDSEIWRKTISEHVTEKGEVMVPISKLAPLRGIPERPKLTLKQSIDLAETAGHIGYGLERDPRITNFGYRWEDIVSVFHPQGEALVSKNPQYLGASIMLELGLAVASADGHIDDSEIKYITDFLKGMFMLDPAESQRLESLKKLLVARPPSIAEVSRRLKGSLNQDQLETVAKYLVGVACVDGILEKPELRLLKKIYKSLGLEEANLDLLIDSIRQEFPEPVVIQTGKRLGRKGEAIPTQAEAKPDRIFLDESKINTILQETIEVGIILSQVLGTNDNFESSEPPKAAPENVQTDQVAGPPVLFRNLDPRYSNFLAELVTIPQWERKQFEQLARKFNLMPAGAMAAVNEWSEQELGDFLIEDADPLLINLNLMGEKNERDN